MSQIRNINKIQLIKRNFSVNYQWVDHKNKLYPINKEFINLNTRVKRKWVDIISWNILGY